MSSFEYYSFAFTTTWATASDSTTWATAFDNWYFCNPDYLPTETEEQRLAREQSLAEYQHQQKEVENRAKELLKQHIGIEAFGKLYEVGYIEVDSQRHKGRKYRINRTGYIDVLDEKGVVIDRLCIISQIQCPQEDLILSKKVLLESVEDYALQIANHFRV